MIECQCDLRTKLVGDGCRYCNAQEYIDMLIESLEEQRTWVGLTLEERDHLWEVSRAGLPRYNTFAGLVESKLKEKNT
jgi:hypothetical protein